MNNEIDRWIRAGAEVKEGLRLLTIYAPNRYLEKLVRLSPHRYKYLLVKRLEKFVPKSKEVGPKKGVSFREAWPFLSNPDCPKELKILAADKITAWYEQLSGYEHLFDCKTQEECFDTAKKVLKNYMENRKITSEFTYYLEHGSVLGQHPIFEETKRFSNLRKLSILELVQKREKLKENCWRIKNEISKGNKPHLLFEREERLSLRETELKEVNKIIDEYSERHTNNAYK